MMDYCNGVQGFINFATSIPRNFTRGGIRCPCRKCENKKYMYPDVVMMNLLHKGFMENYLYWYAHGEVFVRNKSMGERVVGSTSSASNMQGVANDNSDPYRNMVIDAMRMNQGNVSQCPIVEEETNANATRFFDLLKDSDKPLRDGCTNHNKLSVVAQVFTIKSDHRLSEVDYDEIIKWARSISPEGNRLNKQNKVFLFKCYWYDTTNRGIRVDPHYGLVEINSKVRLRNVNDVFVFAKQCQQVYYTYTPFFRKNRSRVEWLSILKTKSRGRVKVVQDENEDTSVRDEVFQVSELVEPYRVAPSIDLEENSNFYVFDDSLIDVDVEELDVVFSSSGQANVDEDDDIYIEDCDEADYYSINDELSKSHKVKSIFYNVIYIMDDIL